MTTRMRPALLLRGTLLAMALLAVLAAAAGTAAGASASTAVSPSPASAGQSSAVATPAASQSAGATPAKKPLVNWSWIIVGFGGAIVLLVLWYLLQRYLVRRQSQ